MSKPLFNTKTHVFIGAGPANLHLALKIVQMDPTANIVIIDNRIQEEEKNLEREKARANIFRFEDNIVTEQLVSELKASGITEEQWNQMVAKRNFSVTQGFQYGDDQVFGHADFTQIQIRDLQQLLLDAISNRPNVTLINQKIDISHSQDEKQIRESIKSEVKKTLVHRGLSLGEQDEMEIHLATGAIGETTGNAILYPDKTHHNSQATKGLSPDVEALMVTPSHGTATFFINGEPTLTCEQLSKNQCSLDMTQWQDALKTFGWEQIRPPRIRVFYANDILYIGAEIPASMMQMDKHTFQKTMQDYTRTIATFVFPGIKNEVNQLKANDVLVSKFPTSRGEQGVVLNIDENEQQIQIHQHGDARYLPHYQTGSGFVTAFLQNELYANIYQHNSFFSLYEWASKNPAHHPLIDKKALSPMALLKQYEKTLASNGLKDNVSETMILKAFQNELFMAGSREIIDKNKEKVGRYLNGLHRQELLAMENNYSELFTLYQKTKQADNITLISPKEFNQLNRLEKWQHLVTMLKQDNLPFLNKLLPQLLNMNMNEVNEVNLKTLRDMHVADYERQLNKPMVALTFAYEMQMQLRERIMKMPAKAQLFEKHLQKIESITTQFIQRLSENPKKNDEATMVFEQHLELCAKAIPQPFIVEIVRSILDKLKELTSKLSLSKTYKERYSETQDKENLHSSDRDRKQTL